MMSRMMAHVAAFFFVYSVQFIGSPAGLGTRVWLGVIGILCLIYQAMTHRRSKVLNLHSGLAGLLLLLLVLLALIAIVFNSTSDLAFITYAPSMLIVAFAAFSVAQIVRHAYPDRPGAAAKQIFIAVVVVQLVIALLMFLIPDFGNMLNNLQVTTDLDRDLLLETGEFRLSGLGARFFGAGIANCYALILIAAVVRSTNLSRARVFYLASAFLFITSFGMMMSRTTMIGTCLAITFLALPLTAEQALHRRFRSQRRAFWLSLVIAPIVLLFPVLALAPKLVANIEPILHFGFELFVNYFKSGQVESQSSTELLNMFTYDFNLPLLIGDGFYADPKYPNQYYKSVDIGYIRLIYYFGIPGLLTYLLFQYQTIRMSAAHLGQREGRKFLTVCLTLVLLLNIKGFTDIFVFSIYMYACVLGRDAFFRIAKPTARARHPATALKPEGGIVIASTEEPTT